MVRALSVDSVGICVCIRLIKRDKTDNLIC